MKNFWKGIELFWYYITVLKMPLFTHHFANQNSNKTISRCIFIKKKLCKTLQNIIIEHCIIFAWFYNGSVNLKRWECIFGHFSQFNLWRHILGKFHTSSRGTQVRIPVGANFFFFWFFIINHCLKIRWYLWNDWA